MCSNKVKLLNKEQLIIAIEQSGNDNIAGILRDKNLDGQELLDLTELKIINWRLTPTQRKELFTFINNLKVNPSNPLLKYIAANISKYDTDFTKSSPIKFMNHDLTLKINSNTSNSTFGISPEMGISGKKANFVQELNSLLSGSHGNLLNPSTNIPIYMEIDSNQARPLSELHVENLSVASSHQTPNIPKFIKDDERIISEYDHRTASSSPIFHPENAQFHKKDSMNLLLPIAQPLQNILKTSPKPNRKPIPSRPGQAKSMGDLVNGWDEAVSAPPVPLKQKLGKKISDHGYKISMEPDDIRDYSDEDYSASGDVEGEGSVRERWSPGGLLLLVLNLRRGKKEITSPQPILSQFADAVLSPGTNFQNFPQNVPNVFAEVNRKPIPLPTRGKAPLVQVLDQTVAAPIPSTNQKIINQISENEKSIEIDSTGKDLKKKTRKSSLPTMNHTTYPRAFVEPSLPQSPENMPNVSSEVNRKPIPIPLQGLAQPLLGQANCAPPSKQKFNKKENDNKFSIDQDSIGKSQESDELRKNEESSSNKLIDLKEGGEPPRFSTFYIPLEENTPQGTADWVPSDMDDHGYLEILSPPDDKNPVPPHPKEYEFEKKSETRNDFLLDLTKAVKEKVVQKKVTKYMVQNHSHLSSIVTPPSSADELFDEDQEEEYTDRNALINKSTICEKVTFQPLPRPPTRMVTPEFYDEDVFYRSDEHDATRFNIDNLSNEQYYMHICGKETKQILMPQENGSFLFRPSKKYFLVLTIKHSGELYNFGFDLADNGKIYLNGNSGSALGGFSSLAEFVNYFCCEPITFMDDVKKLEIYMNPFLGPDSFLVLQ